MVFTQFRLAGQPFGGEAPMIYLGLGTPPPIVAAVCRNPKTSCSLVAARFEETRIAATSLPLVAFVAVEDCIYDSATYLIVLLCGCLEQFHTRQFLRKW